MGKKDEEFLKKLRSTFRAEAEDHLKAIALRLLELEKGPAAESLESIFREVHSLKGAARSVTATGIEKVCQTMESVLSAMKRGEMRPSPEGFDLFHRAVNMLESLLSTLGAEETADNKSMVRELVWKLGLLLRHPAGVPDREPPEFTTPEPKSIPETLPVKQTVRMAAAKIDSILFQSEELILDRLAASQRAVEIRKLQRLLMERRKRWSRVYPRVHAMQRSHEKGERRPPPGGKESEAADLIEFMEWDDAFFKTLETMVSALSKSAERDQRSLSGRVDGLLEDVKNVLMLPVSSLLEIFPKIVRDLSRDRGKEADWEIHGDEIELDRRILEEMKEPLIHVIRNCIDHGIELPEERARKGKPRRGKIVCRISQKDVGKVEISVSDDGAGIDLERVKSAAVKMGAVRDDSIQDIDNAEWISLIFRSGLSTSPIVTDLSGRGLGLAILREKVGTVGGDVSVESHPGTGTAFRMLLPMTLATFRGTLIRSGGQLFVLPTSHVDRVMRIRPESILTVENRRTIETDGRAMALVRLRDILELAGLENVRDPNRPVPVVVMDQMAFEVDEILHEQEVLVKNLGPQLRRVRNIAGATVLGSGQVVPILNVADLMKSAVSSDAAVHRGPTASREPAAEKKSILVAEDSITSRTLLKNILESAGYVVKTAVDGLEALTTLKSESFDLVVSDVEMPRMDGFDLTAKIRSNKKLAELPVVLVTALESREDRERGIDVGANAYIVKSSFDQGNLLDVIRRLI